MPILEKINELNRIAQEISNNYNPETLLGMTTEKIQKIEGTLSNIIVASGHVNDALVSSF